MIVAHVAAVVVGTVLAMSVLISALETVVLPRNGFTRIARCVFAVADRVLVRRWRNNAREANLRALYAPIALVSLPLAWMLMVTLGFSSIFWGIGSGTTARSFEISGSSLFTLGFAEPQGTGRIWLTFIEATIGLGLVALLISYLPTIYAAHTGRAKGINVLRPFAGVPPSSIEMISSLHRLGVLDNSDLWRNMATWFLDLEQTHSAFPALCYFPEASPEESWVASVGTVLDAAALLLSASAFNTDEHAGEEVKGPLQALAYGIPAIVKIGIAAGVALDPPGRPITLLSRAAEPAPDISIRREEYLAALVALRPLVDVPEEEREDCWRRFAWVRSGYDRALRGLAGLTLATPALWTTDRPATVGRPRLLLARSITVDWSLPGLADPHGTAPGGAST
jgi:hypothetical protein